MVIVVVFAQRQTATATLAHLRRQSCPGARLLQRDDDVDDAADDGNDWRTDARKEVPQAVLGSGW